MNRRELLALAGMFGLAPTYAHAHTPVESYLVVGGFLLVPGIIASILAARGDKLLWLAVGSASAIFCTWLSSQELSYIAFFLVLACPFLLILGAILHKRRYQERCQYEPPHNN